MEQQVQPQTQTSPPPPPLTPLQQQQPQQLYAKLKNYSTINTSNNNFLLTNINNNYKTRLDSSIMAQSKANNNSNYSTIFSSSSSKFDLNKRQLQDVGMTASQEVIDTLQLVQNNNYNSSENNNLSSVTNNFNKKSIIKRNSSLINFKSLDISLKSIYSNFRSNTKSSSKTLNYNTSSTAGLHYKSNESTKTNRTPYLKVDTVDRDQETALLTYHQSPGGYRGSIDRQSKIDLNYLSTANDLTRSQSSSPFLSINSPNLRRSSTSDIIGKKGQQSGTESRRPSTTDMLRKARERKGSERAALGRSMSHGGLGCRGGMRSGRRTSMAF